MLQQGRHAPRATHEQIGVFMALTAGLLDRLPVTEIGAAEERIARAMELELPMITDKIGRGEKMSDEDRQAVLDLVRGQLPAAAEEE